MLKLTLLLYFFLFEFNLLKSQKYVMNQKWKMEMVICISHLVLIVSFFSVFTSLLVFSFVCIIRICVS